MSEEMTDPQDVPIFPRCFLSIVQDTRVAIAAFFGSTGGHVASDWCAQKSGGSNDCSLAAVTVHRIR
jgi:hypothetical protein